MPRFEPAISIVIPTYNRARFLGDSLPSALAQACDWDAEVLVVDDGSTDGTREAVAAHRDERLRYLTKEHSGAPETRNLGIAHSRGTYLLWVDSDDVLLPGVVARYRRMVEADPDIDVLYGDLLATDANLEPHREIDYPDWRGRNAELVARLVQGNAIPNPGTLVRRACYERFGPYDRTFRRCHDYEWWSRVAGSAVFQHAGARVLEWRWHDTNMSTGSVSFDTSFDARVVSRMVTRYTPRALFPDLDWADRPASENEAIAHLRLAVRLAPLGDVAGALAHARESRALMPSREAEQAIAELERHAEHTRRAAASRAGLDALSGAISRAERPGRDKLAVCTDLIHRIEREFDVNALRCGELLVWPIVRCNLWHQMYMAPIAHLSACDEIASEPEREPSPGQPALFSRAAYAPFQAPIDACEEKDRYDLVFYARDEEYAETYRGRRYNRLIDPLLERAKRHYRCAKLQLSDSEGADCADHYEPTLALATRELFAKRRALEGARGALRPQRIEHFAEFQRYMRGVTGDFEIPESHFVDRLRRIDDHQAFFVRALSILAPRAVLMSCYYLDVQMALVRACKQLGIPSVDLQHGTQAPYHQAYDRWERLPPEGYDTLPDYFWVWGEHGRRAHARFFPDTPAAPRVVVGGFPWLTRWSEGDMYPPTEPMRAYWDRLARHRRVVLVTLSSYPEPLPDLLVDAIARAPADWIWLFRLHPLGRELGRDIRAQLAARGIRNYEIEEASRYPLYATLRRVTHHVTRCSSCVYEALALGVPSALYHPCGVQMHEEYVAAGLFCAVRDPEALLRFVEREPSVGREAHPYFDTDPAAADRALAEILGGVGSRTPSR